MATWTEDRAADFAVMQAEWGVELTCNGMTATVIKGADVTMREAMPSAYLTDVRSTFDIARDDWTRMGLGNRSQFTCGGIKYEVMRYRDDNVDASVSFDAVKLK